VTATFCARCGARLPAAPPTVCGSCGYQLFVNARPTGGLIVLDGARFLALRRVREPSAGRWDLPSGFCDGREHPAAAALREAGEELGVRVAIGAFVGMYLGDYLFQDELLPVLDSFWLASIVEGELRLDPSEASDHAWFPLADPPPMAFATMDSALLDAAAILAGQRPATGLPQTLPEASRFAV
jgi:8-oxo-dGTP pyrophosphatase MutT (NUDIX family)